jgi:hypothetical protein
MHDHPTLPTSDALHRSRLDRTSDHAPDAGRLRIALVAPPAEAVPPIAYGGTERIVYELATELHRRGHAVTVFASGDSNVPCELVPTVPRALRSSGFDGDASGFVLATMSECSAVRPPSISSLAPGLAGVLLAHASPTRP